MLFLKSWLQDYIDLSSYSNETLTTIINTKCAEVDEVKDITDYFDNKVVVGRIENVRKHPDADRLNIFDVNIGSRGSVQIVSAAPNVRENLLVPVALDGAQLAELTIQARPLRGEKSEGMCCGKSELCLETGYSAGLWEVEEDLKGTVFTAETVLGKSICEVFPEIFPADTVFDISVLPNRIGVFGSYLGFALELSTILGRKDLLTDKSQALLNPKKLFDAVLSTQTLNEPKSDQPTFAFSDETGITNSFGLFDVDLNSDRFDLDKDLKRRMFLSEINIVGNATDISNYILADIGHPTHFFSYDAVTKDDGELNWSITRIKQEQNFKGLGQLKKKLLPKDTAVLVNDENQVLALPGVSGASGSKIEKDTRMVVEIANFYDEDIARASFALKYRSDGSKVWAGGVNQSLTLVALMRLRELLPDAHIGLISLWKGGEYHKNLENFVNSLTPTTISVPLQKLADRLDSKSLDEWKETLLRTLGTIGYYNEEAEVLTRELFYSNLSDFEDVLEDVARLVGFENLNEDYLSTSFNLPDTTVYDGGYYLKHKLSLYGFDEVITRPFVSKEGLVRPDNELELTKAQNTQEPFVRDNLLTSLLGSLSKNLLSGYKDASIFELNRVYVKDGLDVKEQTQLDAVTVQTDVYALTTLIHDIHAHIDTGELDIEEINDIFGAGYRYTSSQGIVYELREVANKIKKSYQISLSKTVYYLHIDLTKWDNNYNYYSNYYDESEFPIISRSYSFDIDSTIRWKDVKTILERDNNSFRVDVKPQERRQGDAGETLTYAVDFVSSESTLSGDIVSKWEEETLAQLQSLGSITQR